MPPFHTQLIATAAGLQASLNMASEQGLQDSVWAATDQFYRRYHCLPDWVMLHESLPDTLTWRVHAWLAERGIRCSKHRGEREWLLTAEPEGWRVKEG
jgi:hypothetical protein